MCIRFQFCTHQRVCILYFLKKSQIRCTLMDNASASLCSLAASIPGLLKRFKIRAQAATVYFASFAEKRVDGAT
jgi:hypothetical protein